jgi:DNA-binding FadR family transcriptional regulator
MDAVEPLEQPRSLTAALGARLTEAIESGRYAIGDQLPSEKELMRSYGVSRTVVREAVAALRAAGLVTTRRGRGAFIAAIRSTPGFRISTAELSSLGDVLQALELRLPLEVEAARLAADRRDPADLERIESALRRIDEEIAAAGDAVGSDLDFHLAVAGAAGNPYFPRLLSSLGSNLIPRNRVRAELDDPASRRRYLGKVQDEHRAILAAIRARDARAAAHRMARHLRGTRYRIMVEAGR